MFTKGLDGEPAKDGLYEAADASLWWPLWTAKAEVRSGMFYRPSVAARSPYKEIDKIDFASYILPQAFRIYGRGTRARGLRRIDGARSQLLPASGLVRTITSNSSALFNCTSCEAEYRQQRRLVALIN